MPNLKKVIAPLDMLIESMRRSKGVRPNGFYDHMRPGSGKYADPEYHFKIKSSDPDNVRSFRDDGMSYKMIPSDRIYANEWYSDPKIQAQYGHPTPIDANAFKKEFVKRGGPTIYEREIAQRAYDRSVGREIARQIAEGRARKKTNKFYMNTETGSVDSYDGWYYTNEDGKEVNAVDLGEVVEVVKNAEGDWVEANYRR